MSSPFIYRFSSAGHYFVYDVNTNGVFDVDKAFYDLVEYVDWKASPQSSESTHVPEIGIRAPLAMLHEHQEQIDEVLSTIKELNSKHGASSANRPLSVQFPIPNYELPRLYPSLVGHLILCVTEQCNLRCTY